MLVLQGCSLVSSQVEGTELSWLPLSLSHRLELRLNQDFLVKAPSSEDFFLIFLVMKILNQGFLS